MHLTGKKKHETVSHEKVLPCINLGNIIPFSDPASPRSKM
jgi:hypothetical protein